MGKRELFIVLTFLVAGMIVYRVTVPSAPETGRRLSVNGIIDLVRGGGRSPRAVITLSRDASLALVPGTTEVRLSGLSTVVVTGEARDDLSYDLTVESSGSDSVAAEALARQVTLVRDDVGPVLALSLGGPPEARVDGALTIRVPAGLQVRIDGSRHTTVRGVAGVVLDRIVGDVSVTDAGSVEGTHRNGTLTIAGADRVMLGLAESRASFSDVREQATIVGRNGVAAFTASAASIAIDGTGMATRIDDSAATIAVSGTDGEITIARPRGPLEIDVRRTTVSLAIDEPVAGTVFTTERSVDVAVAPGVPFSVDARTVDGGAIRAQGLGASTEILPTGATLVHTIDDVPSIAIRNRRGDIVIAEAK